MRFGELHLLKYGNFEGCGLAFPKIPIDFHVIFGPNEAGKSTTLAAVGDLLFGFPSRISQAYRFDASLLRVGGILEQGPQQIQVRRKRGRGSLMDGQDSFMDEAVLAGMLHGQTRDTFHSAWSLDHSLLRAGGQAIIAAKNDIGQALFAAGSGLVGVKRIQQVLDEEADGIWGPRVKDARTYHAASKEWKIADDRRKAAEVRPAAWTTAHDEWQKLEAQQKALDARGQRLTAEQRTVERARRVLEPMLQLQSLQASLAGQTAPLLTPVMESLFQTTFAVHGMPCCSRMWRNGCGPSSRPCWTALCRMHRAWSAKRRSRNLWMNAVHGRKRHSHCQHGTRAWRVDGGSCTRHLPSCVFRKRRSQRSCSHLRRKPRLAS